tara:strand:- start:200 stop:913 length:714 start_codon:yes stop_codon:yes gene_type:complete
MICAFKKNKIISFLKVSTTNLNKNKVVKYIQNFSHDNIFASISSVVPKSTSLFKKLFKENGINHSLARTFLKTYNIKTALTDEKSIGDDRLINVVYGKYLFSNSLIIIDFGTATTIDVINKKGIYDGGVITPGIDLSLLSLKECTAKLPLVKFKKTKNIVGKNTLEAIQSGFFWGYISMIQGLVKKIEENQKIKFKLILTGGNSILFKGYFKNVIKIDEFFNSKGLNYLINNYFSQR